MLEEVRKHIAQLKNLVSLKYVDPPMRGTVFLRDSQPAIGPE
jgi:hypothetical protein